MTQVSINPPTSPVQLEAYRVPVELFVSEYAAYYCTLDAEYRQTGNIAPWLSRVKVFEGGSMIALYDANDPLHVLVLTAAPTAAILRIAVSISEGKTE